jgi:transcriptional antiterminator
VQYKFETAISLPKDETGAIAPYLADYLRQNFSQAQLVGVYAQAMGHKCEVAIGHGTFIEIKLALDENYIRDWTQNRDNIGSEVLGRTINLDAIFDGQVHCPHQNYFIIETFG